jgi:hypothetical protein
MPFLAINSSSSPRYVALGDHLVASSHRKTTLVKAYLQGMAQHHIIDVGRVAVVLPAIAAAAAFSSDAKGFRP